MYLANIKLWNFRKFGSDSDIDYDKPDLDLDFTNGLNVLIGENDSGKSAIIDAIKLVLKTHSYEWLRITDDDFYNESLNLRIELIFENLSNDEAKNFTEWLGLAGQEGDAQLFLRLIYDVRRNSERIFPSEVKAGADDDGYQLTAEAKDYLKTTYLRPLRDAKAELIPKKNSRLAQIFQEHDAFKGKDDDHHLIKIFNEFNKSVEKYFEGKKADDSALTEDQKGKELKAEIDGYIQSFYDESKITDIRIVEGRLKNILEKLELSIKGEINPGLGTLNRLFMASELLHLNKPNWDGVRLGLIEELEAHLHPQAQMQVIESLQKQDNIQLILTTHSPNLASKVNLKNLIICKNADAYPLGEEYTKLEHDDYLFLEHFLDTTKANLFFAKGLIMVEGWAEELILPALARKMKKVGIINKDLTESGVSIVNVGGTAFLRYSRIFLREEDPVLDIPVAILTDVDVRSYEKKPSVDADGKVQKSGSGKTIYEYNVRNVGEVETESETMKTGLETKYNCQKVKVFVAPKWTLEYSLIKSPDLNSEYIKLISQVHPQFNTVDPELALASKLINKSLNKTGLAYKLAQLLDEDCVKDPPEVQITEGDEEIKYLIDAIKYATNN